MNRLAICLSRAFAALASVIVMILAAGLYERATTNEEAAARHIQKVFQQECASRGIDQKEFQGPILRNEDIWHYEFYWKDLRTARIVLGQVQFFPIRSEIWLLDQGATI